MQESTLGAGELLFREGDPSDRVFVVLDGTMEILRNHGDQPVLLGVAKCGQMIGEMGVIRDRPRSATVRAVTEVKLAEIARDDFLSALNPDNPLALKLLRLLCERLGDASRRISDFELRNLCAKVDDVSAVRVLPGSDLVAQQIGEDGVQIETLPFKVGRRPEADATGDAAPIDLCLAGRETVQMSRQHFAVEDLFGDLVVHDLGSDLGTFVNGRRIAHFEESVTERLRFGENQLQAGGADSPCCFTLVVE